MTKERVRLPDAGQKPTQLQEDKEEHTEGTQPLPLLSLGFVLSAQRLGTKADNKGVVIFF